MERIKLKALVQEIPGLEIKGSKEIEITGLCSHSKQVAPGNLFIARRGKTLDAGPFIEEAVKAGAVAVLTDIYNPFLPVAQLIHSDLDFAELQLALYVYQCPSKKMKVIGITGTNGKTTSSYLIKHLLDKANIPCGLIGTIESIIGKNHFPATMTTPDLITNQKLLADMVTAQQRAAVMEVSSHGLDQGRVRAIDFEAALFTNLTQDHLDYHRTMEEYGAAKRKLFSSLSKDKTAILNADDSFSETIQTAARRMTYGIEKPAFLTARAITLTQKGLSFTAEAEGKSATIHSALIGRFNVYNLLGVLALGLTFGLGLEESAHHLHSFKRVPGRLSPVPCSLDARIFIDYAHTDDALKNVLMTLNELKKGRLITVFGCGGNRDQGKRPKMGHVAEKFSDLVILTSDNPRSEDPASIAKDVVQGMQKPPLIELDRRRAIETALQMARAGDIVLIAGKGHEKVQLFAHQTLPFDDFEIAREIADQLARTQ